MIVTGIGIAVLALLLVIGVLLRYAALPKRKVDGAKTALRKIDIASFQNLISQEDDLFLRQSLQPRSYRMAKRARTRAMQEYLWWIAEDCDTLQAIARSVPTTDMDRPSAQGLMQTMVRLRMIALALWCCLWLQWILPGLDLMSGDIARRYERVSRAMSYLQHHPRPVDVPVR